MNIHLLAIVVFLMSSPSPRRTALAVTAELCLRPQKNQPQWLASSSSTLPHSPSSLIFIPAVQLHPGLISSSSLLKLQVASNPA